MKRLSFIGIFVIFCSTLILKAENLTDKNETIDVQQVKVYPNPINNGDELTVITNKDFDKIEIVNIVGSVIYFEDLQATSMDKISINGLDKGIYFIKITYTDNTGVIERIWVK
jgi:hypothetical protein